MTRREWIEQQLTEGDLTKREIAARSGASIGHVYLLAVSLGDRVMSQQQREGFIETLHREPQQETNDIRNHTIHRLRDYWRVPGLSNLRSA